MEELNSPWAGIDVGTLHRVTDPRQAVIVADPVRSSFLRPFLGRTSTVTAAAAEVGCSANAMLYRVRRMLAAGVLRVVGTRPRAGRAVTLYRSSHDGYFVPMDALPYDDLRHRVATQGRVLSDQLVAAYTEVLARSGSTGRVLARAGSGDVWATDLLPSADHRGRPAFFADVTVWLTAAEAAAVRRLLTTAIDTALEASRTASEDRTPRAPYVLAAAVLPHPG